MHQLLFTWGWTEALVNTFCVTIGSFSPTDSLVISIDVSIPFDLKRWVPKMSQSWVKMHRNEQPLWLPNAISRTGSPPCQPLHSVPSDKVQPEQINSQEPAPQQNPTCSPQTAHGKRMRRELGYRTDYVRHRVVWTVGSLQLSHNTEQNPALALRLRKRKTSKNRFLNTSL